MRPWLAVFLLALLTPRAEAANRDVTQDVPISVTAFSREQLAETPRIDLAMALPGSVNTLYLGQSDAQGPAFSLRGVNGTPNLMPLVNGQYAAAYVPGVDGINPTLLLGSLSDINRIEVLRGPQGTLFGRNAAAGAITLETLPSLDDCAGIEFEVDLDALTLTATKGWCDEPVLMLVDCPTTVSIGETVRFEAVVSEAVNAQVEWSLGSGLTLAAEYRDYKEDDFDWGAATTASYTFERAGRFDLGVTATNAYGTDAFTCPVNVEEKDEPSSGPEVRLTLGYNLEWKAFTVGFGGSVRAPTERPIYADLDVSAFQEGGDRSYLDTRVEVSYEWDFEAFSLRTGIGLHALRQSSEFADPDWELGPGFTVRGFYDAVLPFEPLGEVRVSRLYDTSVLNFAAGLSYGF